MQTQKVFKTIFNEFKKYKAWIKYAFVFRKVRGYTMIPLRLFIANLEIVKKYSFANGAIVECGTWKGGMIAGIASLMGNRREYYLFDSFEGLPVAKKVDGKAAIDWQSNKDSKYYFNNCTASEQDAISAMKIAGIHNATVVKGWFNDSLAKQSFPDGISILRMDADFYDSTMDILNNLFDKVNKWGLIIIDDYYTWDGCSKAIHDYLSFNKCAEKINALDGVCYIIKQ